ncbi:MAG: GNAT family N-acetyltransferase [Fimbriimonadaceae bacterium]|nr:GNAT family N-acetyltransferase [Fimbriimonadaceae bacterium]
MNGPAQPVVAELTTASEFQEAWAVLAELRTQLDLSAYLALLEAMRAEGYRQLVVRVAGQIVAVAGFVILTNLYHGRHVYVYDLVTTATARSQGYGRLLLGAVEELGRGAGCQQIALTSGVQRLAAHRFYEQHLGYERMSHSFRKHLR